MVVDACFVFMAVSCMVDVLPSQGTIAVPCSRKRIASSARATVDPRWFLSTGYPRGRQARCIGIDGRRVSMENPEVQIGSLLPAGIGRISWENPEVHKVLRCPSEMLLTLARILLK